MPPANGRKQADERQHTDLLPAAPQPEVPNPTPTPHAPLLWQKVGERYRTLAYHKNWLCHIHYAITIAATVVLFVCFVFAKPITDVATGNSTAKEQSHHAEQKPKEKTPEQKSGEGESPSLAGLITTETISSIVLRAGIITFILTLWKCMMVLININLNRENEYQNKSQTMEVIAITGEVPNNIHRLLNDWLPPERAPSKAESAKMDEKK